MLLIECSPPFQKRPSFRTEAMAGGWRIMWAWFAVTWVPYGFNEYVEELAQSGIALYRKGELEYRGDEDC